MQLCLGIGTESGASLQEQADAAVGAGFRWLDLRVLTLDAYLAHYPSVLLASLLQERGLYVGMVSGLPPLPVGGRPALRAGHESFLLYQAHLLSLCTDLDALGGGTILVPVPQPVGESPFPSPVERALRTLADLAAPFEARLAATPLPDENAKGGIEDVAAVVERVKRPNLGLGLDVSEGVIPAPIPAPADGKMWAVRLGAAGWIEGNRSQLCALCAELVAAGFNGPCSIAPAPGATSIGARARAAMHSAAETIQKS